MTAHPPPATVLPNARKPKRDPLPAGGVAPLWEARRGDDYARASPAAWMMAEYPHGLVLVWGALRRQGRFVLAALGASAGGLVLSVGLCGFANHLDYLSVLSFIARHGEHLYANQSINGLLNRLLDNGSNLDWDWHGFAPFHPAVWAGTTASSLILIVLGLFGPVSRGARGSTLDLGTIALTCTLASPVAWEHHYGVLLPVYAVLFGTLCRLPRPGTGLAVLGVSYALTSNCFPMLNRLAATPLNFLQSCTLAGGLLALGLLYRLRGQGFQEVVLLRLVGSPKEEESSGPRGGPAEARRKPRPPRLSAAA